MQFRIADSFTGSLAKLTGDEQKAVKTPGMQFHRLENEKDKNLWSVRVSCDLRIIVHLGDQVMKVLSL